MQGIAQILGERIVMDESQVLTGSFMDYHMPRADEYPSFEIEVISFQAPVIRLALRAPVKPEPLGPLPAWRARFTMRWRCSVYRRSTSRQRRSGYGKR